MTLQFARAITISQALLGLCVLGLFTIAWLPPQTRRLHWADFAFVVGALGFTALAVTSGARLSSRERWSWWGAMVTNVGAALVMTAAIIYIAIETAQTAGTDPGMVLVAVTFVGLPIIAISAVAVVLLILQRPRRST
jgi:hypothetical protein